MFVLSTPHRICRTSESYTVIVERPDRAKTMDVIVCYEYLRVCVCGGESRGIYLANRCRSNRTPFTHERTVLGSSRPPRPPIPANSNEAYLLEGCAYGGGGAAWYARGATLLLHGFTCGGDQ